MALQLDRSAVPLVDVGGRGGKEAMLARLFPRLEARNEALWDAHDPETDAYVEFKKQADLQWFDIGKYHRLKPEHERIRMVFILHRQGVIDRIFAIDLGDLLRLLTSSPEHRDDGWCWETIAQASALKQAHPRLQLKVPLKVRAFFEAHRCRSEVERLFP